MQSLGFEWLEDSSNAERKYNRNIDEFLELINREYLFSEKKILIKKLHQEMSFLKFINNYEIGYLTHLLDQIPRSGKSILILLIVNYLFKKGLKKILIMTSVVATINSFIENLYEFVDFKDIKYVEQENFMDISNDFNGIVFCSVQYLKINSESKKEKLKNIGFDCIIIDECHLGSSTIKTKENILKYDDVYTENQEDETLYGVKNQEDEIINVDIEIIRKNIKLCIFASGTSDKTKIFYNIPNNCIYEWKYFDICFMKNLNENNIDFMKKRHGDVFLHCLNNVSLNTNYSKCPKSILLKHSIGDLITKIDNFNLKNQTKYGYSCSSLFALIQKKINKKKIYDNTFEICQKNGGDELLVGFLKNIINDEEKNLLKEENQPIVNKILKIQTRYNTRKSTKQNPLLFLIYLPTHTGNNNIKKLQETLVMFLYNNKLWSNYLVVYSNALTSGRIDDDGNLFIYQDIQEYNYFIEKIMTDTKNMNKNGCILLLGDKGGVGITYKNCDATISLDDGLNLDKYEQRISRSMTDCENKTIGINVDMNVQRTFLYKLNFLNNYRKTTKSNETNAKLLKYLYEENIFIFDPDDKHINFGNTTETLLDEFFENEAKQLMENIDDTYLLEEIKYDYNNLENILNSKWNKYSIIQKKERKELEGENCDCPKGEKNKFLINDETKSENETESIKIETNEIDENELIKEKINMTLQLSKCIIPLMALISRTNQLISFKDILIHNDFIDLIKNIILEKKILKNKIDLDNEYNNIVETMNEIIDKNQEIINNIREIYLSQSSNNIRKTIEKHFIPSQEEKKNNAEIPTPIELVDEMLDKIPEEFWKQPNKVFEPCCGKGNFVLGIFDRFYEGLKEKFDDKKERCKIIITECIYYADITCLNVFITTELLKCHIQSYCFCYPEEIDYGFNSSVGDSLKLDIKEKWGLEEGFEAVIGNPPYNSSGNTGTGNTIWQDFTKKSLNDWLKINGYLLYVHPAGWRKPESERSKFKNLFNIMTRINQMIYLEIHGIKDGLSVFGCGTRYDWYLIEKKEIYKKTIIKDEIGEINEICLKEWLFLPNSNFNIVKNIINCQDKIQIICDFNYSRLDKKIVSKIKNEEYKHTLIYLTPKKGIKYMYSNINNKGHFGISKVIIGETGMENSINDFEGLYGMTQDSFGIIIQSKEEGEEILKVLNNETFKKIIIKSCSWSNFRIDWRLFKHFKKDFWKEFI